VHPLGLGDRHGLRDHAAHRHPAHVRGLDAEVVEQAERVVGEIGHGVGDGRAVADERTDKVAPADSVLLQVRRPADVTVVVANDVEPTVDQVVAELVVPPDRGAAQSHHEQQRWCGLRSERAVRDLDPTRERRHTVGHGSS
jgi:hypothetical protein